MAATGIVRDTRATSDARLGLGVAAACVIWFGVFAVLPVLAPDLPLPTGLDAVWALGGMLALVLAPVAAGLAAYASVRALWLGGDALTPGPRRLHLLTLALVAALFLVLVSAWGSGIVSWWQD